MAHDRRAPDHDRLLVARIAGIARRHASWRVPAGNEIAAAVAELREVAGDRPDLLAEVAGIQLGFHEGGLAEPRAKAAAQLLIAAGADESLIRGWIDEGRRWSEIRHRPPVSNPDRGALRHPEARRAARALSSIHRPIPVGHFWSDFCTRSFPR